MDEYPQRDVRCPVAQATAEDRAAAEQAALAEFPEATNAIARLHAGEVYVEVWSGDRANTWTPTAAQIADQRSLVAASLVRCPNGTRQRHGHGAR